MTTAPSKNLETFPNPQPDRDYIIEIRSPEFTCLCPKTGQPDFATLFLEYVPDQLCVELKSLKLYIWSFRNEGHFHEKVTNTILNDLVAATQPRYLRLRAEFNVRGGVYTNVTAEHRKPGWNPGPPPPGHLARSHQDATAATTPARTASAKSEPKPPPESKPASKSAPKPAAAEAPAVTPLNIEVSEIAPAPAAAESAAIVDKPAAEIPAPGQRMSDRFRMLQRRRAAVAESAAAEPATAEAPEPVKAPPPPPPVPQGPERDLYIGLDLGTTGCRAAVLDTKRRVLAQAAAAFAAPLRQGKQVTQDANEWWKAASSCLKQVLSQVDAKRVHRIAVAGASSTLLFCDKNGQPVTPGLMANDRRAEDEAERVASVDAGIAPHGASSSVAKLLWLQNTKAHERAAHALHQADWISNRLTGEYGHSDYHNGLELGYDPQNLRWSPWLAALEVNNALLPQIHAPGETIATISTETANTFGLPPQTEVVAGTTDGIAAFLTTGAHEPGHGVTALGNTIALKLLCEQPLNASQYGVYSHRLGRLWLAGGSSNSGGAILLQYFTVEQLQQMGSMLDPEHSTELNYYPLPGTGERFPINDPKMQPHLEPLPGDSTVFLQGLLEGMANIEARGYELLTELGAPALSALWTTGGGAQNAGWTRLRERIIGIKPKAAKLPGAACGAGLLAMGVVQKTFA